MELIANFLQLIKFKEGFISLYIECRDKRKRSDTLIIKKRNIPIKIHILEALLRRLPPSHPKWNELEEELSRAQAGLSGEKALDYILSYLPPKEYLILQDIRLLHTPHFFQIDILIISPRYLLILEVKNYSGQIYFDDQFHQIIQTKNGREKAFPDPISQVNVQKSHLSAWLSKNNVIDVPIEFLIVITNPYTIMRASPSYKDIFQKAIHKEQLLSKIAMIDKAYSVERFQQKEMKKISKLLSKHHVPHIPNLTDRFKINVSDVISGTHCPNCFSIPMTYQKGKWYCNKCNCISKNAHIPSLKDYSLLIKPSITNRELRNFLRLPSHASATYLLSRMNLRYSGQTKGRKYELPFDDLS